jgi:hypothetical protein
MASATSEVRLTQMPWPGRKPQAIPVEYILLRPEDQNQRQIGRHHYERSLALRDPESVSGKESKEQITILAAVNCEIRPPRWITISIAAQLKAI